MPENGTASETTKQSWGNLLHNAYDVIDVEGTQTASNNRYGDAYAPAAEMRKLPLSIPFTGDYCWTSGIRLSSGAYGYFWSSTPNNSTDARHLNFGSTSVSPQGNNVKLNGLTVRCVKK